MLAQSDVLTGRGCLSSTRTLRRPVRILDDGAGFFSCMAKLGNQLSWRRELNSGSERSFPCYRRTFNYEATSLPSFVQKRYAYTHAQRNVIFTDGLLG